MRALACLKLVEYYCVFQIKDSKLLCLPSNARKKKKNYEQSVNCKKISGTLTLLQFKFEFWSLQILHCKQFLLQICTLLLWG